MEKKNVKMLKSCQGSEDGLEVKTFKEGEVYVMDASLANVFIDGDIAKEVKTVQPKESDAEKAEKEAAEKAEKEAAEKAEKEAAQNKNRGNAPSNKGK